MLYCRHCGVSVEPNHRVCPLCRELLEKSASALPDPAQAFALSMEETQPSRVQVLRKRGLIMTVCSVALVIPGLICLMLDWLYNGGGWSGYALISLGLVWVLLYIPLYLMRHVLTGTMTILLALAAFLVGIDFLDGNLNWSLQLGVPIMGWSALALLGTWLSFQFFRQTLGFAIAGLFASAALLCLGIDGTVDLFWKGRVDLNWSLIVLVADSPLILIGLGLGFAWKRSPRLRRFLHW